MVSDVGRRARERVASFPEGHSVQQAGGDLPLGLVEQCAKVRERVLVRGGRRSAVLFFERSASPDPSPSDRIQQAKSRALEQILVRLTDRGVKLA